MLARFIGLAREQTAIELAHLAYNFKRRIPIEACRETACAARQYLRAHSSHPAKLPVRCLSMSGCDIDHTKMTLG
jgi:hypothetical protein